MKKQPRLQVYNRQKKVALPLPRLQQRFEKALSFLKKSEREQLPSFIEISLVTVSQIQAVHAQFLNNESMTDVITFPYGEIVICPAVAKEQASFYRRTVEEEVLLYGLHGLLHLLGYEDETMKGFEQMHRKQEKWLAKVLSEQ